MRDLAVERDEAFGACLARATPPRGSCPVPTRSRDGPRPSLARVDRDRPRADASLHLAFPHPQSTSSTRTPTSTSPSSRFLLDAADDETRRFDAIIGALEDS